MKNCSVKRLYTVIPDNSLIKYGHLIIAIKTVETSSEIAQIIRINGAEGTRIKVVGDGYLATTYAGLNDESSRLQYIDIPASKTVTFCCSNGNYFLDISKKYELTAIARRSYKGVYNFNIDDLEYCTNLSDLSIAGNNTKGNIKSLDRLTHLTGAFDLSNTIVDGDIASLSDKTSLTSINFSHTRVTGDIASLSQLSSLTAIEFYSSGVSGEIDALGLIPSLNSISINATEVSGTIEGFVANRIASGTATFTNNMRAFGFIKQGTLGGHSYNYTTSWVNWESTSKIWVLCGGNSVSESSLIYEKGATAEEIAAWQAAGKTVTDVTTGTVYPPTNS